jgi:hypothetical protein
VRLGGIAMSFGGILMRIAVRVVCLQRGLFVRGGRPAMGTFGIAVVLGRRSVGGECALQ